MQCIVRPNDAWGGLVTLSDVSSSWRSIVIRRWYLLVVGLVVTCLFAAAATVLVPPTYTAQSTVLLLPPSGDSGDNPYLGLGGVSSVPDVLAREMTSTSAESAFLAAGMAGTYTVNNDDTTSAPVILISAAAASKAAALRSIGYLTARAAPTLTLLQSESRVPGAARISTRVLNSDHRATAVTKSTLRAQIVGVLLGLVLTALLVLVGDRVLARRRPRGPATEPTGSGPTDRPAPAVTEPGAIDAPRQEGLGLGEPASDPAPGVFVGLVSSTGSGGTVTQTRPNGEAARETVSGPTTLRGFAATAARSIVDLRSAKPSDTSRS